MGIIKRIYAVVLLLTVLSMGLACINNGDGPTEENVPPEENPEEIPEGKLYLYQERMGNTLAGFGSPDDFKTDYIAVDILNDSNIPLWGIPGEEIWLHGLFFFMSCYGENGVILTLEPDNAEENISRFSVALHPRGINFTRETLDFIEDPDNPENTFIIMDIMEGLETGGIGGLGLNRMIKCNISIKAGGNYVREEKEGSGEIIDYWYGLIDIPLKELFFPKSLFQSYLTQLIYDSAYNEGEDVSFAELCYFLIDPLNRAETDFQVTLNITLPFSGLMTNRVAESLLTYSINYVRLGTRIYSGDGNNDTGYRVTDFSDNLAGREIIRTQWADRGNLSEGFLSFNLERKATLYMAVDPGNEVLINWLVNDGWVFQDQENASVARRSNPEDTLTFNLYSKEYDKGVVTLPGNGDATKNMYFVIADAGTFPFGLNVIVSAHTTEIHDNIDDASTNAPAIKREGGIVVNNNGIVSGGDAQTGYDLVHANFVQEFDANVLVNTEGGAGWQRAVGDVTDIQFIEHILTNNGFRLIDTYNDQFPAFWGENQVLSIENITGYPITPIRLPLLEDNLYSFANMNLLNSPNLVGVYVKAVRTDDENINVWKDEPDDKGMDVWNVIEYLDNNAVNYRYFISVTGEEVSLVELLKRIGKSEEGELTFRVFADLPSGKMFEMAGGAFIHDYFTNVYDIMIGDFLP